MGVQELTYELELAQSNAGDLRKLTDSLSTENKSLSHQVLTLREQNNNLQKQKFKKTNGASINDKQQQQIDKLEQKCRLLEQELNGYKQRLVAKGGNAKQLYRADTVTKWSENDLAQIQNDLQQALQAQHQQNIAEQMDKQYNLRTEHQYKMKVTDAASISDDDDAPKAYDRAFRDGAKTEWQQSDLDDLQKSMKQKMQEMATKDKQERIAKMAERNDAIRDVAADESSAELIVPTHGYGDDSLSDIDKEAKQQRTKELMKQKMQELAFKDKQARLAAMAERNDLIREPVVEHNDVLNVLHSGHGHEDIALREEIKEKKEAIVDLKKEEIKKEMQRMRRQRMNQTMENSLNIRTEPENLSNTKVVITSAEDKEEMRQQLMAYNKQKLFVATDTFSKTAEPQINASHKDDFDALMQSIGILNTDILASLWSNIEQTVNGDKREEIVVPAHGITPSQMIDVADIDSADLFKEEMEQIRIRELKRQIFGLQTELESMRRQKEMDEDDLGILETGIETKGDVEIDNHDHDDVALEELKNKMNKQLNDKENEIQKLNQEIERVSTSKIQLLINTSKEIDALRQLLSDYVKLAKLQKEKNSVR